MALLFNGSSDQIICSTSWVKYSTAATLSAWIYPTSFPHPYNCIFQVNDNSGTACFQIYVKSTGQMGWYPGANSTPGFLDPGSATLSTNTWYHVLMLWNPALGQGQFFINAASDGTIGSGNTIYPILGTSNVAIGFDNVTATRNFAGRIAHVGFWNSCLSGTEIWALARGARPDAVRTQALIGYWPLGQAGQAKAQDNGPIGNLTGVVTGTVLAPDPPLVVTPFRRPRFFASGSPPVSAPVPGESFVLDPSSFYQVTAPVNIRSLYYQTRPTAAVTRTLPLDTGFYSLTGKVSSLLPVQKGKGFSFVVRPSSFYAITAPVDIRRIYYQKPLNRFTPKLSANTGFYTLTGEPATLTYVAKAQAGFSWEVLQPSLFFQSNAPLIIRELYYQAEANVFHGALGLDRGLYTLTGEAISVLAKRTLALNTGFYSLTGEANSLNVSRPGGQSFALQPSDFYNITAPLTVRWLYYQAPANVFRATLPLNTGYYTLTGEAVSTTATRTLSLATGFYTLTGEANTLTVTRLAVPGGVSFALQPSDFFAINAPVNVRWLYYQKPANIFTTSLSLNTGFYVLTGKAVTATATRTLSAATGFYTLTGEANSLTVGRQAYAVSFTLRPSSFFQITAPINVRPIYWHQARANVYGATLAVDTGFYTLTGQPVTLQATGSFSLALNTGFYTLTGEAATFTATHLMPAGQIVRAPPLFPISAPLQVRSYYYQKPANVFYGTLSLNTGFYTLTGEATSLLAKRTVPAATGFYTLTGKANTLTAGRVMSAATGFYSLTGEAVTILAKRTSSEATGFYNLTGEAITALAKRSAALATGYYALAGQPSNFGIGMGANTGTYALTGEPIGMKLLRRAAAATGYYTLTGEAVGLFSRQVTFPQPGLIGVEQPTTLLGGAYPDSLTGTQQNPPSGLNAGIDQPSLIGTDTTPQP